MVEIRRVAQTDITGVMELFETCFGKRLSEEHWRWKYVNSPWGSTAVVAIEGDDIIAHYGAIKLKFYFRGAEYVAYQPCDVMTHPRYRARLFTKRGAMVKAGELFFAAHPMDFAFGFPSERHALIGIRQLGYTNFRYVTVLKKELRFPRTSFPVIYRITSDWGGIGGHELDRLWDDCRDEEALSIVKDSRYFFWRFRDCPSRRYESVVIRSALTNRLRAFAVLTVNESEAEILDLLCPGKFISRAICAIERHVVSRGLATLRLWMNAGQSAVKMLIGAGYSAENGVPLIFRILNQRFSEDFLFEHYKYSKGDYDAS